MKIIRQRKFSRFGMIQTVWPDLAKFCHFGKILIFWVPPYLNGFICISILESQAHHLRFYQCKFDLCHVVKTTINKKMPRLPHSKNIYKLQKESLVQSHLFVARGIVIIFCCLDCVTLFRLARCTQQCDQIRHIFATLAKFDNFVSVSLVFGNS